MQHSSIMLNFERVFGCGPIFNILQDPQLNIQYSNIRRGDLKERKERKFNGDLNCRARLS